jgi:hypothetical protein
MLQLPKNDSHAFRWDEMALQKAVLCSDDVPQNEYAHMFYI